MSVIKINASEFEAIKGRGGTVLIDFYADWCGPCRMVAPVLQEIAAEREDVTVVKVNVDEEKDLARVFGIYSIPTLVVLKDGVEVNRAGGARPKAKILELLD